MTSKFVFIYLFFLFLAFSSLCFAHNDPSLVVGHSTALQFVPNVQVRNSPGAKPNVNIHAGRVYIHGLSRMKNLKQFSHAVKVLVVHQTSSHRRPKFEICFHRNASLGIGMCPSSQWKKVLEGSWDQRMSPFDHKILDIRMSSSSLEPLDVTLQEEYSAYRIVFLILGTLLITLAPTFSESLIFYYSSAMAVGVILVVLVVLFQGMKILPTGRRSSLAIFMYSTLIGVGSFLLSYLPHLLRVMLAEMGISEDMYNPLAIFFLLFVSLAGAWLGFWIVRKLVLTEEGLIDTAISQFVAWSIRIFGAVMILQSSLDPLLAAEALLSAVLLSSILCKVIRPRLMRRLYRKLRRTAIRSPQKLRDHDSSSSKVNLNNFQYSQDTYLSPPTSRPTGAASYLEVTGLSKKTVSPPIESDTFYSSYHKTPQRRKLSEEEWKSITKECTREGLVELVSSPEFSEWATAHAERLTLAPVEKERPRWFSWFR